MFESVWLKLKIRIVSTTTPLIKSNCKIYWLKVADVCEKPNTQFVQTLFILRSKTGGDFGRNWRRWYFHHNIFDISQSQRRIVRVSKGSNKKPFALVLFQFCEFTTQQRFILQKGVIFFPIENSVFWSIVYAVFSNLFIKRARVYSFPHQNSKQKLDKRSRKTPF